MSNWKVKVETDVWKLSDGSFYEGEYLGEDKKAVKVCKAGFKYQVSYLEKIGYLKFKKSLDKKFLNSAEISNYDYKNYSYKKNSFSFGWIIFVIIFGSCWYGFNALQDLPDVDPADYLSPAERKEICYEVYDTPDLRGELIACIARVNSDS